MQVSIIKHGSKNRYTLTWLGMVHGITALVTKLLQDHLHVVIDRFDTNIGVGDGGQGGHVPPPTLFDTFLRHWIRNELQILFIFYLNHEQKYYTIMFLGCIYVRAQVYWSETL